MLYYVMKVAQMMQNRTRRQSSAIIPLEAKIMHAKLCSVLLVTSPFAIWMWCGKLFETHMHYIYHCNQKIIVNISDSRKINNKTKKVMNFNYTTRFVFYFCACALAFRFEESRDAVVSTFIRLYLGKPKARLHTKRCCMQVNYRYVRSLLFRPHWRQSRTEVDFF